MQASLRGHSTFGAVIIIASNAPLPIADFRLPPLFNVPADFSDLAVHILLRKRVDLILHLEPRQVIVHHLDRVDIGQLQARFFTGNFRSQ